MKQIFRYFLITVTLSSLTFNIDYFSKYYPMSNVSESVNSEKYFKQVDQNLPSDVIVLSTLIYNDELFVGTVNHGLFVKNPGSDVFTEVLEVPINSEIRNITQDNNKNIWLSTWNAGLWEKKMGRKKFIQIPEMKDKSINLIFCDQDDHMLIGTRGSGLWEKTNLNQFIADPTWNKVILNVEAIAKDNLNNFWVGTLSNGLYKKSKDSSSYIHVSDQPISGKNRIQTIYLDNQNNLWVGTWYNGLWRKLFESDSFEQVSKFPDNALVSTIYEDNQNNLWVGTGENFEDTSLALGIFEKKFESDKFINIVNGLENNIKISSISEDVINDDLYIGSYDAGLYAYGYHPVAKKPFPIEIVIGVTCGLILLIIIIIAIDTLTYNRMGLRKFFVKNKKNI